MTETQTDLTALLDRVRSATGPDRELDAAIISALGLHEWAGRMSYHDAPMWIDFAPSNITASIDAALALTERVLPGWIVVNLCEWEADVLRGRGPWTCTLKLLGTQDDFTAGKGQCPHAASPALALVFATFSALISGSQP